MRTRGTIGGVLLLVALVLVAFQADADELSPTQTGGGEASYGSFAPPGYLKVFEDHFAGPELNTDHWTFGLEDPDTGDRIPGAAGAHLLNGSYDGYATEEDTYIEDGALVLRNQKRQFEGDSPAGTYQYTTGWVMSMHKVFFNKGYIEFRAKFPRGDKVWPALWLIPESLTWPPEWDLWEYFGFREDVDEGYDIMGTHLATGTCCDSVIWNTNWLRDYDATYGNEEWHVYGFEWTDEGATWWIDGEPVHSLDASDVSMYPDEDFYIVMNNGTRAASPDTNTEWPNHLVVDYVEIYELSDEEPVLKPDLRVNGRPNLLRTGPSRKQVRYRFLARNAGDAPSGTVRLCAHGPPRQVRIRSRCVNRQVPAGAQRARPVVVRIRPAARGKVTRIRLSARGPNVENRETAVRLRVRG